MLALATPQLESDKRTKENACIDTPDAECEVLDPNEVIYRTEEQVESNEPTDPAPSGSPGLPGGSLGGLPGLLNGPGLIDGVGDPTQQAECTPWDINLVEELGQIERTYAEEARSRNGVKQAFDQFSEGRFRIDLSDEDFEQAMASLGDPSTEAFLVSMRDAYKVHTAQMDEIYENYERVYNASCDPKPVITEVSSPELMRNREYGLPGGPVVD